MNYITAAHTIDGYNVPTKVTQPTKDKEQTVTRVEIINENGRDFVDYDSTYKISFQDNNKTLKLFKISK